MDQTSKLEYKLASPVIMWVLVLIGGIILWNIVPPGLVFASGVFGLIVLILAAINWIYISMISLRVHHSAPKSVHNIKQLVTEGAYAVVRHPLYAADIVFAWSIWLWQPSFKIFAIVVWLTLVLVFWANFEERMLEEKFLDDYREYKKRVPMFIPRIRK